MLAKKYRLTRAQVERLVKQGTVLHSPHLTMRVLPSIDGSYHFGFSASRKVAAGAVDRNRLRRRGYRALECILPSLMPHLEGVFFFKRGSCEVTPAELGEEIRLLLFRALS